MMHKQSDLNIELDGADVNYSSTKDRKNFSRIYFNDLKDYYSFKRWVKNNLIMYDSKLGDYDDVPIDHLIIFLNYLCNKFKNISDRPYWYKKTRSIYRYANRLKNINLDDE